MAFRGDGIGRLGCLVSSSGVACLQPAGDKACESRYCRRSKSFRIAGTRYESEYKTNSTASHVDRNRIERAQHCDRTEIRVPTQRKRRV